MGLVNAFNKVMDGVTGIITGTPAPKTTAATTAPAAGAAPQQPQPQGFMSQMMQNPMQKIQQVGQVFQQPTNTVSGVQEPMQQAAPMYDLNTIGQQVATLQTQVAALQTYVNQLSDYLYAHHEEEKPELQTTATPTMDINSMAASMATQAAQPTASVNETPAVNMETAQTNMPTETVVPQVPMAVDATSTTPEMPEVVVKNEIDNKQTDYVVVEPTQQNTPTA